MHTPHPNHPLIHCQSLAIPFALSHNPRSFSHPNFQPISPPKAARDLYSQQRMSIQCSPPPPSAIGVRLPPSEAPPAPPATHLHCPLHPLPNQQLKSSLTAFPLLTFPPFSPPCSATPSSSAARKASLASPSSPCRVTTWTGSHRRCQPGQATSTPHQRPDALDPPGSELAPDKPFVPMFV